jgi:NADPH:quinone reductase
VLYIYSVLENFRRSSVQAIEAVAFGGPGIVTGLALTEAASGRIKPVIGQAFSLKSAADAHRAIESRAVVGKTLLEA